MVSIGKWLPSQSETLCFHLGLLVCPGEGAECCSSTRGPALLQQLQSSYPPYLVTSVNGIRTSKAPIFSNSFNY